MRAREGREGVWMGRRYMKGWRAREGDENEGVLSLGFVGEEGRSIGLLVSYEV